VEPKRCKNPIGGNDFATSKNVLLIYPQLKSIVVTTISLVTATIVAVEVTILIVLVTIEVVISILICYGYINKKYC